MTIKETGSGETLSKVFGFFIQNFPDHLRSGWKDVYLNAKDEKARSKLINKLVKTTGFSCEEIEKFLTEPVTGSVAQSIDTTS